MGSWQEHLVPYQHVTYWHTICYSCVTKTDKCQEGRKLFTYPKNKRVENKVPKDSMDSGLGTPLKCSKQIPENTWFEENYAQNVSGWNNLTLPNTSVLLSETAK